MLKWIKEIGQLRDGFLVGTAVVYLAGYLVWSVNAWFYNLGHLPALEAQYFLAGVPALLITWLTYLVFRMFGAQFLEALDEQKKQRWRLGAAGLGVIFMLVEVPLGVLSVQWAWFYEKFPRFAAVASFTWVLVGVMMFACFAIAWAIWRHHPDFPGEVFQEISRPVPAVVRQWFGRHHDQVFRIFVAYVFASVSLLIYVVVLYPFVPQEIGGLRPKCAILDLVTEELSKPLVKQIAPAGATLGKTAIVRSKPLEVFYHSDERFLVKLPSEYGSYSVFMRLAQFYRTEPIGRSVTFDIKAETVKSVEWCTW